MTHPPPYVMSTPSPPPHHPYMHPSAAAPPADSVLQKRIDKLVEYIGKNGLEFEATICDKQHDNPDYTFVFGGKAMPTTGTCAVSCRGLRCLRRTRRGRCI